MNGMLQGPERPRGSAALALGGLVVVATAALWISVVAWPEKKAQAQSKAECKRRGCRFSIREWKCICPKRPRPRPRPRPRVAPSRGGPMVPIKGKCFNMGARWGYYAERPVHTACLSSFSIDKYEVTVNDYARCVTAGDCSPPNGYNAYQSWSKQCNWGASGKGNHPVNCVDWYQARSYCRWAKRRLPTEAEWEYAARGTDGRKYPWGNSTAGCAHAVARISGSTCRTETGTMPVGSASLGTSPFGAMDLMGNVSEWVEDCYDSRFYRKCGTKCRNPANRCTESRRRILRGGGYAARSTSGGFTAYHRASDRPTQRLSTYGFRCASSRRQRWSAGMVKDWCKRQGCGFNAMAKGCRCGPGLSATPLPVASTGYLNVRSTPSGADVIINGTPAGVTPLFKTVNTGLYRLEVQKAGVRPYRKVVRVNKGRTTYVYATLKQLQTVQCVGGSVLVSGRCVCPSGTVWSTTLAKCVGATRTSSVIRGGPMLRITPRCFWMGSPRRQVCLSSYAIDKYEVRVDEYAKCVKAGGCTSPVLYKATARFDKYCNWGRIGRRYHPVNCVSWYQARQYCGWAGKRLPSNAEWLYAAIAGMPWKYPWGNLTPTCSHGIFKWCWSFGGGTWAVGRTTKGKSYFGAMDMAGNVAEWVEDCYTPSALASCGLVCRNPVFRCTGTQRIARGGGWTSSKLDVHAYPYATATTKFNDAGIRCARTL